MATLNGTTPAATYQSLIKFDNNSAIGAAKRLLSDGNGGATPIYLSSTQMNIGGTGLIDARFGVKGTGATSATKSFYVENSNATRILFFDDNGVLTLQSGGSNVFIANNAGINTYAINSLGGWGNSKIDFTSVMDLYSNDGTIGIRVNNAFTGINDATAIGQITAPNSSAMFDVISTTKGFLPPRMTNAQILLIATPAAGLMAYNTTLGQPCFYDGAAWNKINHSPM